MSTDKKMIIKDPQKLLPDSLQNIINISNTILEIPTHGIPLHPQSVEKLLFEAQNSNSIIVFKPTLPVTSELGLPEYPILAYIYPQEFTNIWSQVKPKIPDLLRISNFDRAAPVRVRRSRTFGDRLQITLISEIETEEQIHYFANHYGQVVKPSYVRVIVGNTCNLKCVMCPYHSPTLKSSHITDFFQGKKFMSWEMMEKIAKDCGEAGLKILIGSVEEPLLHPQLIDFIALCRKQGVPYVHLTTNGQILNETLANELLQAGLTSIDISIDAATPETYQKIRGSDFERVESNVINFIKIRDELGITCEVRTSFVRNRDVTIEEENQFLARWLSQADSIFVLNMAEYQDSNMRLINSNKSKNNSLQYYQQKAQGRWACLFPFVEMAVLPDGKIYYCIESLFRLGFDPDNQSLGDYNQQSLPEIWSGILFQQLRQDLILNQLEKRSVCQNCETWKSQVIDREVKDEYQIFNTTITEIYTSVY